MKQKRKSPRFKNKEPDSLAKALILAIQCNPELLSYLDIAHAAHRLPHPPPLDTHPSSLFPLAATLASLLALLERGRYKPSELTRLLLPAALSLIDAYHDRCRESLRLDIVPDCTRYTKTTPLDLNLPVYPREYFVAQYREQQIALLVRIQFNVHLELARDIMPCMRRLVMEVGEEMAGLMDDVMAVPQRRRLRSTVREESGGKRRRVLGEVNNNNLAGTSTSGDKKKGRKEEEEEEEEEGGTVLLLQQMIESLPPPSPREAKDENEVTHQGKRKEKEEPIIMMLNQWDVMTQSIESEEEEEEHDDDDEQSISSQHSHIV